MTFTYKLKKAYEYEFVPNTHNPLNFSSQGVNCPYITDKLVWTGSFFCVKHCKNYISKACGGTHIKCKGEKRTYNNILKKKEDERWRNEIEKKHGIKLYDIYG